MQLRLRRASLGRMGPSFLESQGLLINEEFLSLLQQAGLQDFDRVMQFEGGELVSQRGRTTVVRLKGVEGQDLYIKRHRFHPRRDFLRAMRRLQRVDRNGKHEWCNILRVRELGIDTVTPVACGRRRTPAERDSVDSCLITLGLVDAEPVDSFYLDSMQSPPSQQRCVLKRTIIEQLGSIVGSLHRQHLYHQDTHLRHFYIRVESEGKLRIALIDLQPLIRSWWVKHKIKDLARLYLDTLTHVPVSRADRMRFYWSYLGRPRLNSLDRLLFLLVTLKARWMGRGVIGARACSESK